MLKSFNRPCPVAWFFFLLGFSLCLALGTWQVQRLQWKTGLIAEIAAANAQEPLTALPREESELAPLQFRKVRITGSWHGDIEFHLTPRYWRNQFGYWVISPFTLKDGRTILINRGWVPRDKKTLEARPETRVAGHATLDGILRVGAERSAFTPPNQPEKNLWFGRDVAEMATTAELDHEKLVPAMLDLTGEQDINHLPIPSDGTIRLRNDHLSYILTWYGIAAGILVIFLVYHRKK